MTLVFSRAGVPWRGRGAGGARESRTAAATSRSRSPASRRTTSTPPGAGGVPARDARRQRPSRPSRASPRSAASPTAAVGSRRVRRTGEMRRGGCAAPARRGVSTATSPRWREHPRRQAAAGRGRARERAAAAGCGRGGAGGRRRLDDVRGGLGRDQRGHDATWASSRAGSAISCARSTASGCCGSPRRSRRCCTRASRARTRRAACSTCCCGDGATRRCTSPASSRPAAYERLIRARPELREAFDVVRVEPMDEPRTLALAAAAAPGTDPAVLREALALGRHFLGDAALPGALLVAARGDAPAPAGRRPADDGRRAGDDHRALRAAAAHARRARAARRRRRCAAFFNARVIGQPEAVECMVERVALRQGRA